MAQASQQFDLVRSSPDGRADRQTFDAVQSGPVRLIDRQTDRTTNKMRTGRERGMQQTVIFSDMADENGACSRASSHESEQ